PAAKEAVPEVARELNTEDGKWALLTLEVLAKIDPMWTAPPTVKETIPGLVAFLVKSARAESPYILAKVCPAIGAAAVPELVKSVEGVDAPRRRVSLVGLREIGPAAKDAVPGVLKALKDKDGYVRQPAVPCLARIGAGSPGRVRGHP